MGWRENLLLLAAIGVVSIGLTTGLAVMGYWAALPFAGLELLAVAVSLYKTLERLEQQEVITITKESITVEWGRKHPDRSVCAPRPWSRLRYCQFTNPFEVGLLSLLVHNKSYKLGAALGKEEKHQLYFELKQYFDKTTICSDCSH